MEDITKNLAKIKTQIAEAKRNEAVQEGRLQEAMKQLKEAYGLTSVEEAEKELEKIKEESRSLEVEIQKKYKNLQEQYSW